MNRQTFFFCGIGGSGMSAIAQVLLHQGHAVRGSDRSYDQGQNADLYARLQALGVALFPQDGSGVDADVDVLVVSSAVEPTILDVQAGLDRGIAIRKRAEVLADLFHRGTGIAVGGTSGKSTVTGMIGHILNRTGRDPTVINGGMMRDVVQPPRLGNALCGDAGLVVIEADESDGTIALYEPTVSVLTNISLDHKPMAELESLFGAFCTRARDAVVVNRLCERSMALTQGVKRRVTFGVDCEGADVHAADVELLPDGVRCVVNEQACRLRVPGRHNVANAVAAIATCGVLGISVRDGAEALGNFRGIGRRLEVVGEAQGVTVIDDFAHNPDKIAASLATLKAQPGRVLSVFQPHGFGPTRFLMDGLISAFINGMEGDDLVIMSEIFYAGGTAQKDISSGDLIAQIARAGRRAEYIERREDIVVRLAEEVRNGDRVVVMGARDDSLTDFARDILLQIESRVR
ncbi:MAG: UDP-N-acetylmuramate--alanine ligase [Gemmatimonadetes bacterium]|nr:UDP-N-acetylmuramate--alanine ligase [Gemmatimonadota bacterium]